MTPARREALGAIRVAVAEMTKYTPWSAPWKAAAREVALAQVRAVDAGCTPNDITEASA